MDELAMFLENEIFTLCPVPYQFTIFDLQVLFKLKLSFKLEHLGLYVSERRSAAEIQFK